MKRRLLLICIVLIAGSIFLLWTNICNAPKNLVLRLINEFGKRPQNVPLQAPREVLAEFMTENYGESITKALLFQWIDDSSKALGRRGSSP